MGECHRNKENGNFFQQSREFRIKLHGTKKRHKSWDYMSIGTFTLENREIHSIKSGRDCAFRQIIVCLKAHDHLAKGKRLNA